jgi:prepilin-type N-terminal cleavage/methylation domain-containing protein
MRAHRRLDLDLDGGFTLIEVVVALVVFVVISVSVLSMLLSATSSARTTTRTSVAAALAARQIESVRGQRAVDITDGAVTRYETVSGVRYTIVQSAVYVAADSSTDLCSGGSGRLANKLVTVTVTWAGIGRTPPVRAETLRALGVGADGLSGANAAVAVAVRTALDTPVSGVDVTIGPSGAVQTTGADGCVVFAGLSAGTYTVAPSGAGYVDPVNDPAPAGTSVTATAGGVTRVSVLYDVARSVATTVDGPAGYQAPATGLPLTLRSSSLSTRTLPACAGATTGCAEGTPPTVTGVYPAVYTLWWGACLDAATGSTVDLTADPAPSSAAVVAGSALVDVRVLGVSTAGRTVTATHAADAAGGGGCPSGETYPLPATAVGGVGVLLPFGAWTFSTPGALPVTATLTASGTPTVILVTAL